MDVEPLSHIIGQDRGMSALRFGLDIKGRGYNVYAAGPSGTGKKTAIINYLTEIAKALPTPPDWCYVYNFDDPRRPKALGLPAGKGVELRENMKWFVQQARETLTKAFSSERATRAHRGRGMAGGCGMGRGNGWMGYIHIAIMVLYLLLVIFR